MLQLTSRDEAMLDWMNVVRLADVDAIRWALSAYQHGHDGPVSVRRANHWVARMAELGYLGRANLIYRSRQVVWPTFATSGRAAPKVFQQTTRHEVLVAAVSARYLAAGFEWSRDGSMESAQTHRADGVARRKGHVELVEIELSAKSAARYKVIVSDHALRLAAENVHVRYLCTVDAGRAVSDSADRFLFRTMRPRLHVHPTFDATGRWIGDFAPSDV